MAALMNTASGVVELQATGACARSATSAAVNEQLVFLSGVSSVNLNAWQGNSRHLAPTP